MILRRVRLWANQTWHRFGHPVTQDETEKKYVNCKRFDIAVELKGCYLERAGHVIVGISRHPWRCDCPRQSRQGMFAWIASYTSMGA
jgi:hypothetical protein